MTTSLPENPVTVCSRQMWISLSVVPIITKEGWETEDYGLLDMWSSITLKCTRALT